MHGSGMKSRMKRGIGWRGEIDGSGVKTRIVRGSGVKSRIERGNGSE
jgi:hypothetical protein